MISAPAYGMRRAILRFSETAYSIVCPSLRMGQQQNVVKQIYIKFNIRQPDSNMLPSTIHFLQH
jgi:hypothetical protein